MNLITVEVVYTATFRRLTPIIIVELSNAAETHGL